MALIKLSERLYVKPQDVSSLSVGHPDDTVVVVRMRDGQEYTISRDYGKSVYTTMDRLAAEINAAEKEFS